MRGERLEWAAVFGALIVAIALGLYRGSEDRAGARASLELSFVPKDAENLACASASKGDRACAFEEDGVRATNARDPFIPAVASGKGLILVRSALSSPAGKKHLQTRRKKNERFVLHCDAVLLEASATASIRFDSGSPWKREAGLQAWVAESCR